MLAKICGVNNLENMNIAIKSGASALGFLVGITHKAEDKITNDEAKELIKRIPPFISSVAVTHLTDIPEIIRLVDYIKASTVQIHDYVAPESIKAVREALPHVKIIKAVHVMDEAAIETAKSFVPFVDSILLDSRTNDRLGGTGLTHDWNISRQIVEAVSVPVILAGGLTPDNVYEAVTKVKPFAVDVNSGVEIAGDKDEQKIRTFIQEAAKAEFLS